MMVAGIFLNIYLVKIDVKFIYAKRPYRRKQSEIVLLVVVFVHVCGGGVGFLVLWLFCWVFLIID